MRSLLINRATSVLIRSERHKWIVQLLLRRLYNVPVAALANKIARYAYLKDVLTRLATQRAPTAVAMDCLR